MPCRPPKLPAREAITKILRRAAISLAHGNTCFHVHWIIEGEVRFWKWRRDQEFDETLIDWCGVIDLDDIVGTMKRGSADGSRDKRCKVGIWAKPVDLPSFQPSNSKSRLWRLNRDTI